MKQILVFLIIYLATVLLAFLAQIVVVLIASSDGDQSSKPSFKMMIKQSFQWPWIIFKVLGG
jgi:hypothetical protein